jgi:hypothetical protein
MPGKAQICGRLYDTGTSVEIDDQRPPVRLFAVNALGYASNPQDPEQSYLSDLVVDACGRFHAGIGVVPPATSFVGVVVDDPVGAGDAWVTTGVALSVAASTTHAGVVGFATPVETLAVWDAASGLADSLTEDGAVLQIFVDAASPLAPLPGTPVAGVQSLVAGTLSDPDDTFYFGDTVATERLQLVPAATATGKNGSALLIRTELTMHGGTGAEPPGHAWPARLADSIPGAILVQLVVAE